MKNDEPTYLNRADPSPRCGRNEYDPFSPAPYDASLPEQALWRAVITQALMDAASNSKKPEAAYFRSEARHWLTENSQSFCDVCYLAGLDPDYTRRMAKKALARNCKWRNEPGQGRKKKMLKQKKSARETTEEPQNNCEIIEIRRFMGAA